MMGLPQGLCRNACYHLLVRYVPDFTTLNVLLQKKMTNVLPLVPNRILHVRQHSYAVTAHLHQDGRTKIRLHQLLQPLRMSLLMPCMHAK
jgi:hypothetical protein